MRSFAFTILNCCFVLILAAGFDRAHGASPEKRAVTIYSDGTRMIGDLYLPPNLKPDERRPAVVFCAGTAGTRKGFPETIAARFAEAGFVFLAFDYRGWGDSDSKLVTHQPQPKPDQKSEVAVQARAVRWQLDFADQTFDIRAAISFLAGEPNVDRERIGILGTSYGGGLVVWVGGNDPRVRCIAAQVPGMGGGRPPEAERRAYELWIKQARGEVEPVPLETGKLGGQLARYDQMRANPSKGIGYDVFAAAQRITAPTLIIVAEKEELLDNRLNGQRAYDLIKARDVPAEYHILSGVGHYGAYRESFDEATKTEIAWFQKHLQASSTK
jgi:dienelactone hydrolase